MDPVEAGSDGGGSSVGGFTAVDINVIVDQNRTAYGGDQYGFVLNVQFVQRFGEKFVDYSMTAAGAVVGGYIPESFRPLVGIVEVRAFTFHSFLPS
jgi:hypothetical protein